MDTNREPDAALLWAREKYQRRTFSHLTPEFAEAFRAGQAHERRADAGLLAAFPLDLAEIVASLGPVEWGATEAFDADGHAAHIKNSVEKTARSFQQDGPQMMHGLYLEGTETVVCHTGTSPNSPQIARALTGAWNRLVEEARAAIAAAKGHDHA